MAVPNEFTLLPELDDHSLFKRFCKVIWRRVFTVGLEFFFLQNIQNKLDAKKEKAEK
jgi:hypothetical protein